MRVITSAALFWSEIFVMKNQKRLCCDGAEAKRRSLMQFEDGGRLATVRLFLLRNTRKQVEAGDKLAGRTSGAAMLMSA